MGKVSVKGVTLGAITDSISTVVVILLLMVYIIHSHKTAGMSHEKATIMLRELMRGNSLYYFLSRILGGICSVLGGYVSANIAKHDEVLNGALSSILCVGLGVYAIISGSHSDPLWQYTVLLLITPMLAAFGGFLRQRRVFSRLGPDFKGNL